jgi:hypothetical protein
MMKTALPLALLARGASAACEGDVSTFTGACTFANFEANLQDGCTLAELYPDVDDGDYKSKVDRECEYGAPVRFGEIQGTYQRDRRYFASGGTLVDGKSPRVEAAPIERFEANLADDALVAFPEYAARVQYNSNTGRASADDPNGYPANMNLATSCDLNTVMCCFTSGNFADNGAVETDVCHHVLEDSPESNHIKRGWSAFPEAEAATHCVGFTWKDGGEELLGNMMYDVSLRQSVDKDKQYLKGIPGAPMCGCVEHMPVVEQAACRTATRSADITYTFAYKPATDDRAAMVMASNQVPIAYADCAAGDLRAQFKANNAGDDAAIAPHLVGAGGCAAEVESYLSDHFQVTGQDHRYELPDPNVWSDAVAGMGVFHLPHDRDYAAHDAEFRGLIEGGCKDADGSARYCLVRRKCASCYASHVDIFYQRLTPLPADVNFLDYFLKTWKSAGNVLNTDFKLYSSLEEAKADENGWAWCNYDHQHVGFPRDCGPRVGVGSNWNSYKHHSHGFHHAFYVERPVNDFGGK